MINKLNTQEDPYEPQRGFMLVTPSFTRGDGKKIVSVLAAFLKRSNQKG